MSRALILYWSIGGTTRLVAEQIALGLDSEGVPCALHDLREGLPEDVAAYDLIGVGTPVHWFRPAIPVTRAIRDLQTSPGASVFAFTVHGTYRGAGLARLRRSLVRAGGFELGAFACHGEDSFYPYARLGAQFSPGHPTAEELEAAYAFGRRIALDQHAIERGESPPDREARDALTHPMYALERFVSGPRLTHLLYSRLFRVDPSLCTRCGKCAKGCPAGNIVWKRGELPRWGRECILCLNCVATCPEEAITCPMDWALFRPFVRWNVNRAWRDPELDHARVELRRGKTVRL